MPSGYRVNGYDFDDLFDFYAEGPTSQITGRRVGGADLSGRYAHIQYGSKRPDVGYRVGGIDVSNLWAAKGTAQYDRVVVPGFGAHGVSYSAAAPNGHAAFFFESNGTVTTYVNNPNAVKRTAGQWLIRGRASDFEIQFWRIGGEGFIDPSYFNNWRNLGQGAGVGFDTQDYTWASIGGRIRRVSTGQIVATGEDITLSASWRVGDSGGPIQ